MKLAVLISLSAGMGLLTACGGGGGGSSPAPAPTTGQLKLSVGDAPVDDAEKVVVEFSGVELLPASGSPLTFSFSPAKSIDLLALQGGNVAPLLSEAGLPAGQYSQLRLMVNADFDNKLDSYIQVAGAQFELRVPSGSETGLKLVQGLTIPAGGVADFTVDFDLRKSVTKPTGQPGYFLKPVLRLIDNSQVGKLSGTIAAGLVGAQCAGTDPGAVYVFSGADVAPDDVDGASPDPIASGQVSLSNNVYSYSVAFLSAGAYTVAYTCGAINDVPDANDLLIFVGTQNVSISANATTTVNFQ
ncbi:MAG: DUF4382 domain-containing protein [Gammaproteobacteria bacterium]|nr:DUF4382 domain-containing protein [Gammaproteobacteria bacterium]